MLEADRTANHDLHFKKRNNTKKSGTNESDMLLTQKFKNGTHPANPPLSLLKLPRSQPHTQGRQRDNGADDLKESDVQGSRNKEFAHRFQAKRTKPTSFP